MRVTKRTDIAMRVLMYCAVHADKLVTKSEIATACNASGNHVAQIINQLAQLGFLNTRRGRHGGLSLAGPASGISVGAVFRAVEGPEVRVVPWTAIVILVLLVAIAWAITVRVLRFRRNRIDPVLEDVGESFDNAGNRWSRRRSRIARWFGGGGKG